MLKYLLLIVATMLTGCDRSEPTALTTQDSFEGVLNGARFIATPTATLIVHSGAPDSLLLSAFRPGPITENISVIVPMTGAGQFALSPGNVRFSTLVGGDGIVGDYAGSPDRSGTLTITENGGPGGVLRADLEFTADARIHDAELGARITFQSGHIVIAHIGTIAFDADENRVRGNR